MVQVGCWVQAKHWRPSWAVRLCQQLGVVQGHWWRGVGPWARPGSWLGAGVGSISVPAEELGVEGGEKAPGLLFQVLHLFAKWIVG